jgi:hypothetical protein
VAVLPDEDVLRLQVSVDHSKHVQVLQRKKHFGGVEPAELIRSDTSEHSRMIFWCNPTII